MVSVDENGSFSYVPHLNGTNGSDSFEVRVIDGDDAATGLYEVTITPVNDAPTVSVVQDVTNEDTPYTQNISAFDVDNDPLTFGVHTQPTKGQLSLNAETNQYSYAPNENINGADSFVLSVSDGIADAVFETYEVTITPVNDVPVFNMPTEDFQGIEDTIFTGNVTGTDVENDPITFGVHANGAKGSVTINENTGDFEYTPYLHENGLDTFSLTIGDSIDEPRITSFTIYLDPVNDPPEPVDISTSGTEGD